MKDRTGRMKRCSSSRRVTTSTLLAFFTLLPAATTALQLPPVGPLNPSPESPAGQDGSHTFTLRHIFHRGTYQDPSLHKRFDFRPNAEVVVAFEDEKPYFAPPPRLTARSESLQIERLADRSWGNIEQHLDYASNAGVPATLDASQWTLDEVDGPDVTDKDTVINLALMAANAYVPKVGEGEWTNVTKGFNESTSFGWEGDGLRGHIFADEGNKTIVVALKGTSPAVFDGDGTTTRDKLNDNLFFSCCCAQGGHYLWRQVCDCQSETYKCNSTCLVKALKQKTRYYSASIDLYTNVTELYPDSNVWIVGHSLGGSVSSLLGLTFGLPVVTFEAPGDDLAARRLGLPFPPSSNPQQPHRHKYTGARHFGHTADPVFMGTCNGAAATCTIGGYAMESACHSGLQCVYDTVEDLGWRVGIGYHKIHSVIDDVIKKYKKVATCEPDNECVDCFNWKFFKSNGSDKSTTTTTTTTTSSLTRTTTCKTPGWWGCLDETTTGTSTTPVVTTTYTTTTCLTPGWFGCKETANVTVTTTTDPPTTSKSVPASTTSKASSSTCTPGWFGGGCDTTTTTTKTYSSAPMTSSSTTCHTPGFFFGCRDKQTHRSGTRTSPTSITSPPSSSHTSKATPSTTATKDPRNKCKHPVFFGLICLDSTTDSPNSDTAFGQPAHSSEL